MMIMCYDNVMTLEQTLKESLSLYLICDREDEREYYTLDYTCDFENMMNSYMVDILRVLIEEPDTSYIQLQEDSVYWQMGNEEMILYFLTNDLMLNFTENVSFRGLLWSALLMYAGSMWNDESFESEDSHKRRVQFVECMSKRATLILLKEHYLLTNEIPTFHAMEQYILNEVTHEIDIMVS